MFKHYLASALRHFAKHKTTTIINVVSMSAGMACFAIAYSIASYQDNADRYHEKADRTFVVTQRTDYNGSVSTYQTYPMSSWGIGPQIEADYPELETVARAMVTQEIAVAHDGVKQFTQISFADPEFLDVFDLPFLAGDRRLALRTPNSAVITEAFAKKTFGDTNVVGKTLLLNGRETVQITGVVAAPRQPSHLAMQSFIPLLQFSVLASADTAKKIFANSKVDFNSPRIRFTMTNTFTYVVVKEGAEQTIAAVRADLSRFSERHVPEAVGHVTLGLRPASEIYKLLGDALVFRERTGLTYSAWVLTMGALVLVAACFNYANLASAQATTRLKELALRRVVGASHWQILVQSFVEALLLLVVATLLMFCYLPGMISGLGTQFGLDLASQLFVVPSFWIWLASTLLIVALLSCSYPAWVASKVRPAHALQSGRAPFTKRRVIYILVIAQFAAASVLFIVSDVMRVQNERMRPARTSIDDPVVVIGNDLNHAGIDIETLRSELNRQAGVKSVGAIDVAPGLLTNTRALMVANAEPSAKHWAISAPVVDEHFFAVMGVKLLAGRLFDPNDPADINSSPGVGNVVIDRSLASEYGWTNPSDAIGQSVYVANSAAKDAIGIPRKVIGVTENKMLVPLIVMGSGATMYSLNSKHAPVLLARISKDDIAGGVSSIEATWNQLAPQIPLKRTFFDEQFDLVYYQITKMISIYPILAVFAAFVGTLGLVGIATHAMAQRNFEIGVRRTLGASARQVLTMLLKDFGKPILFANLIAWPFSFVLAKAYMSLFADKAPLTFTPFIASLLVGLAIAWLAVLKQAYSAARMNPATVLRHE